MNDKLLYQVEQLLSGGLPGLNSWQRANVALVSDGVSVTESCQQGAIAGQVSCGEQVERVARRWRRWLDNTAFDLEQFFRDWSRWVVQAVGGERITLVVDETKLRDRIRVMLVG